MNNNNNNTIQLQRGEVAVLTTTKMSTGEKSVQVFYVFTNALHWFDSICEREELDFEYYPSQVTQENFKGFEAGGVGSDYRVELTIEQEEIEDLEESTNFFPAKVLIQFGRFNSEKETFTGDFIVSNEDGSVETISGTFGIEDLDFSFAVDSKGKNEDLIACLLQFGFVQFAQDDDQFLTFLRSEDRVVVVSAGQAFISPKVDSLNDAFDFVNKFYSNQIIL